MTSAAIVLLCIVWIISSAPFLHPYSRWFSRHLIFASMLAFYVLAMTGVIGSGFGIANIFWHETWHVQFAAGAGTAAFAIGLWWLSLLLDESPDPAADEIELALWRRGWFPRIVRRRAS